MNKYLAIILTIIAVELWAVLFYQINIYREFTWYETDYYGWNPWITKYLKSIDSSTDSTKRNVEKIDRDINNNYDNLRTNFLVPYDWFLWEMVDKLGWNWNTRTYLPIY